MGKAIEWRQVPGFSYYEVSEFGEVRTAFKLKTRPKHHLLKGNISNQGYKTYKLTNDEGVKKRISAHRLVAIAYIGEQPLKEKFQVAHNDGNRLNNHYLNLRWATPQENNLDKFKHGTVLSGEDNARALLTEEQVKIAREEYKGKYGDIARLARRFGVSHSAMWSVVHGLNWRDIS